MKILLAVDGSPYTRKMLAYLTTHLELFAGGSQYTLLTVQLPLPPRARAAVGKDAADVYYAEESARVLDPAHKFLLRHGIDARRLSRVGNAGEQIAKTADSGGYGLIIMGSRGQGALGSLVMGSVATSVLARCQTPVLLVR